MFLNKTDTKIVGAKRLAPRDGGKRLLAIIRQRKTDEVVMLKLDRTMLIAGDRLATVEPWERSGNVLHRVDLGGNTIEQTTATSRIMLIVSAGAAELERNLTSGRTRSTRGLQVRNRYSEKAQLAGSKTSADLPFTAGHERDDYPGASRTFASATKYCTVRRATGFEPPCL